MWRAEHPAPLKAQAQQDPGSSSPWWLPRGLPKDTAEEQDCTPNTGMMALPSPQL